MQAAAPGSARLWPQDEPGRVDQLREQLRDSRGGRVLFVSHCLLNENVRYLGGATRTGAVVELAQAAFDNGVGLVQMPCPEQIAWGGVWKTRLVSGYARDETWGRHPRARQVAAAFFVGWTRAILWPTAGFVASQITDYRRAGMDVVGVVGVGASPSCGVTCTLDFDAAFDAVATCPLRELTRSMMNERVVAANTRPGRGLFTAALLAALARRHMTVPTFEHDLLAELDGSRELPTGLMAALEGCGRTPTAASGDRVPPRRGVG
jgi:predicted secreted protein